MNEPESYRHGLVERNCSLQVKALWSAGCAIGPFDFCELMTGFEIDKRVWSDEREGKLSVKRRKEKT